ncbi:Probable DNA double-strand break repair Rad50 ATPase [Burkholderia pseudomallei]|nr:Probable DNA double-strand break repair Rad50 ATPase [Burkholderia pseudomallei]
MLLNLNIKNGYRHPNSTFVFPIGQTAITGPNESGKSVTLEMILFALWGSVALRGAADDYKKLEVTLEFIVRDQTYRIVRTTKNAKLTRAGEDVATGTKPVNAKIRELFGYDYDVFTMANAVLQGQIEKLSDAKPTERRKIVDQTIGLNVLDDIVTDLGKQALAFRNQADGIAAVLREPVKPEQPVDFESSTTLGQKRDNVATLVNELNQLRGMVAHKPSEPVAPTCAIGETVETLQSLIAARNELVAAKGTLESAAADQRATLKRLSDGLKAVTTDGTVARLEADIGRIEKQITGLAEPVLTIDQIEALEQQHIDHDMWVQKQKLLGQGEHICPSCDHHWPIASAALEPYAAVVETVAPSMTRVELNAQRALHGNTERRAALAQEIVELRERIERTKQETQAAMDAQKAKIVKADQEVAETSEAVLTLQNAIDNTPDRRDDLKERQAYEGQLVAHHAQVLSYNEFFAKLAEREARVEELAGVEAELGKLDEQLVAARAYEQAVGAYEAQMATYSVDKAKLDALNEAADDKAVAKAAVAEAKLVIKSHLVPSLNKVASVLLNQMTGGARTSIVVDEDFNITVDGQAVQTLSGSGKAVANLALRIGLGQVLTNGVFSVFMADEFDESMDAQRAQYTAECLQRLKETIKQVIIVTHKRPIADHIFTLPLKEAA